MTKINNKSKDSYNIIGEFYYRAMDDRIEHCCPFSYNDSYFETPTTKPNFDLLRLSLKLAMSASRKKDILKFYDDIGFSYTDSVNYKKDNENVLKGNKIITSIYYPDQVFKNKDYINSIAYAIGYKKTKTKTIVQVTIRGGNYGIEWGGNFNVGDSMDVLGFRIASDQVLEGIKEVTKNIEGNIKLNICGYSRSAAVANLTAARINRGEINKLNKDNFSCYTFESPRTTTNKTAFSKEYNNIFNIINPGDLIPTFPFGMYGYRRYGQDLYLPAYETDKDFKQKFNKMKETMKIHLKTVYDLSFNDSHLIDKFVSNLAFVIENEKNYVKEYQNIIEKVFMNFDSGKLNLTDDERKIIKNIENDLYYLDPITYERIRPLLITNNNLLEFNFESPILSNHKMGTELAWIESFKSIKDFGLGDYLLAYFINIDSFSVTSDGKKLASSENKIIKRIENGLWIENTFNENILVILDKDRDYKIEFNNTNNQNGNFVLLNFDQRKGIINSGINYINTNFNKITGYLQIYLDTIVLTKNNEELKISQKYNNNLPIYKINCKTQGSGKVKGGGYFYPGENSVLEIVPDNNKFLGWFKNDKCISNENKLLLFPDNNINILAKFE